MYILTVNKKLNCIILFVVAVFITTDIYSQDTAPQKDSITADSRYREDQLYLAVTFNLLVNKPAPISQNGFSGGLHFGFIRDMPINKKRNLALGLGAGLSMNTYNQNLFIGEDEQENTIFRVIPDRLDYDRNWLSTYQIEVPLQLRWRTSTATSYNFWRIYTGLQFNYLYAYKTNFEQPGNTVVQTMIPELNKYRLGATFSFGYGTFNFYFYYNLTPFFENAQLDTGQTIEINSLKLGLIFYIL